MMAAAFTLTTAALAFMAAPLTPQPAATRARTIVAQDLETRAAAKTAGDEIVWTESGLTPGVKWVDDVVGTGTLPQANDVVQLHYTVSLLSSGTTLGTSRGRAPLTFCLGKHKVPIWDEAIAGMRIGGKRRLLVPPSAIPDTQADKVPGENRVLRFDFELLNTLDKNRPMAIVARTVPPGERRVEIGRTVYASLLALSFVPYFLPYEMQPSVYHDGMPVEEIRERQLARANNHYIGGDLKSIDKLFDAASEAPAASNVFPSTALTY